MNNMILLFVQCQRRHAQSVSDNGMTTFVPIVFLWVKKEKAETKGESFLRCCSNRRIARLYHLRHSVGETGIFLEARTTIQFLMKTHSFLKPIELIPDHAAK